MTDSPKIAQPDKKTVTAANKQTRLCPMYHVILHNDDVNTMLHVIRALMRVFNLSDTDAYQIMITAHKTGQALCCTEPLEPAEFHRDQLRTFSLTATVEPAK